MAARLATEPGAPMTAPRGREREAGACNEPVPVGDVFAGFLYCHRPDNGSGVCNVHAAAKARGAAVKAANRARNERLGWPKRRH